MKDEKILERIRNLLAMAGDTSSPNEAAIAARRARALMDRYQIEEMDLTSLNQEDFGAEDLSTGFKTNNGPISCMAVAVAKLNDTQVRYERISGVLNLRFEGMLVDCVCAIEMMKYLRDEMYQQAERSASGRSDRYAYRLGFSSGVARQVEEILKDRRELKTSNGTGLMVIKSQLVQQKFGVARYARSKSTFQGSGEAYNSGYQRGKNINLSRQVGGSSQRRLG